MILAFSSWFNEPGIKFKIYFKVYLYIRDQLIENIMVPYGLEEKDEEIMLSLVLTTTLATTELEVKGPSNDKRNKTINYGLWLPYDKINSSPTYLQTFLQYYFDALVIFFAKYDVPEDAVREVQKKVEIEVLDNPQYVYRD